MSDENVETARRAHDAWSREDLVAMLALSDPDIEYVNSPTAVEPGTRHGHDGLAAVLRAQWEILTEARLELERAYDRGEDVITLSRLSRRMPESEARIAVQTLLLWRVRDGKLTRIEVLAVGSAGIPDALRAQGLSK
jgi:ketosteroid isomerase-like protein